MERALPPAQAVAVDVQTRRPFQLVDGVVHCTKVPALLLLALAAGRRDAPAGRWYGDAWVSVGNGRMDGRQRAAAPLRRGPLSDVLLRLALVEDCNARAGASGGVRMYVCVLVCVGTCARWVWVSVSRGAGGNALGVGTPPLCVCARSNQSQRAG